MLPTGNFRGFEVALDSDGIAQITFNQPERLNGMTHTLKRDLLEVLAQAQMDDQVRVLVFTGSGRAFSAGDDITGRSVQAPGATALTPEIPRGHHDAMSTYNGLRALSQSLNVAVRNLDKISIASINGVAIQTGFSLALSCDFRLASREARIGSGTLRFGLLPDEGGHWLLVQLVGMARALDLLMRNRILSGEEALAAGLVHEVTEADELMPRTMALARELAAGPQAAMRMLKRSLYVAAEASFGIALEDIAARTAITDHLPDAREGVAAFREKRSPKFA